MILPLTHEKMTVQRLPWITIFIIALNLFVFLFTWPHARRDQEKIYEVIEELEKLAQSQPGIYQEDFDSREALEEYKRLVARFEETNRDSLFGRYGFIPAQQEWSDLVSSAFLHAGWMHLLGNMYLLWLCGCSLEDTWGRPLYVVFFLLSAGAAAMAHAWAYPDSTANLVGASGAIAGLMGAFLIRFYNTRIRFFYWYWIHFGTFLAPAWIMLPLWLLSQVFYALLYEDASTVAFWAHIGGFIFGAFIGFLVKWSLVEEAFLAPAIEEKTTLFTQHPEVKAALDCIEKGQHQESVRHLQAALRANREDIDALQLLAQSYLALGNPGGATDALRRKITVHLRRREKELAVDTYFEMLNANPQAELSAREILSLAPALVQHDQYQDAVQLYHRILKSNAEAVYKLKAAVALADLYMVDHKDGKALEILNWAAHLTKSLPDWQDHIQQRIDRIGKGGARVRA
jgi:membrane associated rhomboid family serine protease